MSSPADTSAKKWSGFFASVWTQVCAALVVGVPSEDVSRRASGREATGAKPAHRAIRSLDDYAGYLTSNGLGSLDIGGGRSRVGE